MSRLAYVSSQQVWNTFQGAPMRDAAEMAHIAVIPAFVGYPASEADYRGAILQARANGADSVLIGDSPAALQYRSAIAAAVAEAHLPAMYTFPESAAAGGLMAYSFDLKDLNHQAARDIDAILKGARPADIPFYQVTRLILTVNLKTARRRSASLFRRLCWPAQTRWSSEWRYRKGTRRNLATSFDSSRIGGPRRAGRPARARSERPSGPHCR